MPSMKNPLSILPSVDRVLQWAEVRALVETHGRGLIRDAIRLSLEDLRGTMAGQMADGVTAMGPGSTKTAIFQAIERHVHETTVPSLKPVFNLTGTVVS